MTRILANGFLRFCLVGIVGFAIDGGMLYLLVLDQFNPYFARLISFPVAVSATWYLNRHWAFNIPTHASGKARDYNRYLLVQVIGALGNYLVYAIVLAFLTHTATNALGALALGALAGLAINYSGSRWWAFEASLAANKSRRYE